MNRFETEAEWAESELEYPDVASIEEDNRMEYIDPHATVGDLETAGGIVLWDAKNERKVVVESDGYSITTYPEETFTPIGVLVCPASHMPDGMARMMALRWMNCDDPENGSLTYQHMLWGPQTDLTGLTNFTQVPIISSPTNQTISKFSNYGHLSSDYSGYTSSSNPQDSGTKWNVTSPLIASPYASDGTPNPNYRATSYSGGSINNPLSYFDGRHQTDVILAARGEKDYGSWKPTYNTPAGFPAVSVCDMYHTVGTNQGDWYLPTAGELGYVIARLGSINNAITKVNGMQALPSVWAWSSSEYTSSRAWSLNFNSGNVNFAYTKGNHSRTVVAFSLV